jgi:beta-phosphoglucomutase-like phosphatase (HAD superfamily)
VTLGAGGHALFEAVGAGDVVPAKKPAPDIYHWVLERLALPAARCLAIEDSRAGVAAAAAARLPVLLTRSRFTRDESIGATAGLLADLDGLGAAGHPATGTRGGQGWSGVVGLETLRAWHGESAGRLATAVDAPRHGW